jgi:hypothetical protein
MKRRQLLAGSAGVLGTGGIAWYLTRPDGSSDNPSGNTTTPSSPGTSTGSPPNGGGGSTDDPGSGPTDGPETDTPDDPPLARGTTSDETVLDEPTQVTGYGPEFVNMSFNTDFILGDYSDNVAIHVYLHEYGGSVYDFPPVGTDDTIFLPESGSFEDGVYVNTGDLQDRWEYVQYTAVITNVGGNPQQGEIIAQTDRFRFEDSEAVPAPVSDLPDDRETGTYTRQSGSGIYYVTLSGETSGTNWTLETPVLKSEFVSSREDTDLNAQQWFNRVIPDGWNFAHLQNAVNSVASENSFDDAATLELYADISRALPDVPSFASDYRSPTKAPTQTLLDGGGDCADVATLVSGLCLAAEYPTAQFYLQFPDRPRHVATGVAGSFSGYSRGRNEPETEYYYLEPTTAVDGPVGVAPDAVKDAEVSWYIWQFVQPPEN